MNEYAISLQLAKGEQVLAGVDLCTIYTKYSTLKFLCNEHHYLSPTH